MEAQIRNNLVKPIAVIVVARTSPRPSLPFEILSSFGRTALTYVRPNEHLKQKMIDNFSGPALFLGYQELLDLGKSDTGYTPYRNARRDPIIHALRGGSLE